MPTFEYQAMNPAGERVSGTVLGSSMEHALSSLSQSGLLVERINQAVSVGDPLAGMGEMAPPPVERTRLEGAGQSPYEQPGVIQGPPTEQRSYMATSVVGPLVGKANLPALAFFYRQLAAMMDAGVPIVQAIDTLSRQGRSSNLSSVLREIRGHVEAGRPISAGMQRYPEIFSPIAMSMVRAGEEGGFLVDSLKNLADYTDEEIELRNLLRRVTFYPKLVLAFSVFVVLATNAFIASLGKEGGLKSPLTTPATWIWLGPLIVGIFLFVRVGLANPRIKYNWDLFLLGIPHIGGTLRQLAMAKFGRAFGALYRGGVPITKSIHLAADACGNEYLRAKIIPAARVLETGAGITETLRSTNAFTPIVMDILETGERTGNVDEMLTRMSGYYEDEAKTRSQQAGHVFGVVVYVAVAIYVLYILIQFYTSYAGGLMKAGSE